jgi:acetyl-CoA carboxylase biotin carboxyl carrier protein
MDFKQIQELIKIINKSNIGELTIEEKDFKITIRQKEEASPVYTTPSPSPAHLHAPIVSQPSAPAVNTQSVNQEAATSTKPADNFVTIKSPMIGTFYRSTTPDKPPFVSVGDEVTQGKTVCIIEAMKLFNEIESEVSGTIVKVLADDASPVEYDQPLFLVEPA